MPWGEPGVLYDRGHIMSRTSGRHSRAGVYNEQLQWFKDNERPEAVLVVAGNRDMERIVLAWPHIGVKRKGRLTPLERGSEKEMWAWLWGNTNYCAEELAEVSNVATDTLERKMKALVGNRVLYPDGTVHSFVMRYLRQRTLDLFEKKARRKPPGSSGTCGSRVAAASSDT